MVLNMAFKMNILVFLGMCHVIHGGMSPMTPKDTQVERRIKRQGSFAERGEKFATFAKEFVSMFGEDGLKIKSVIGIAGKLGPLLGPIGPVFSIIALWTDNKPDLQEIKDTIVQGFSSMTQQLQEAHVKLDRIYKLLLETSQFQMIEQERSFLNGIEEAITKAVQFPEESTRRALRRYCEEAYKAPVDIVRRLNEYVHKDSFPPKLRDALFSYAAGSSARIAIVTKQILADVVRAILFKQTCLGVDAASEQLKQKTANEDQEIFQNLTNTFLEWEKAFVPDFVLNGDIKRDAEKAIQSAGGFVYFDPLQKYLEERASNIYHSFDEMSPKYHWNGRSNDPKNPESVRLSFAVIQKDPRNKIDILNPYRAVLIETTLREKPVQLIVAWNGYKENLSAVHDRVVAARGKLDSVFGTRPDGWANSNPKRQYQTYCSNRPGNVTNLAQGQFDGLLMDMDAVATAIVPEGTVITKDWHRSYVNKGDTDPIFLAHPCKTRYGVNAEMPTGPKSGVLVML